MLQSPLISIVIPLFNEEETIPFLYDELLAVLEQLGVAWEIIFVDDGSRDHSFGLVKELHTREPRVNGISLSRNFGHQIALLAGMQKARGEMVVTMDADLQHPPSVIPSLIDRHRQGYDIINTRRKDARENGIFKIWTSRLFYRFINRLSEIPIEESSSDFRLMSRKAIESFLQFGERDRFTRGLISWMGFRQTIVEYECPPRFAGQSKYTLRKMLHFAADGITAFSSKPLRIASYTGLLVFVGGVIYSAFAIVRHIQGKTIPGWTSLLVTVLLVGGIQLLSLGIIGEYLARIFHESKSRPLYFIKDKTPE
jgi:glycosyltransferase involved in cell wall biosynthesis